MSGENNIYQPGPLVKLFGAPEAQKAVQNASARFPRVWIRRQMEARIRRISALPRGGGRYSRRGLAPDVPMARGPENFSSDVFGQKPREVKC